MYIMSWKRYIIQYIVYIEIYSANVLLWLPCLFKTKREVVLSGVGYLLLQRQTLTYFVPSRCVLLNIHLFSQPNHKSPCQNIIMFTNSLSYTEHKFVNVNVCQDWPSEEGNTPKPKMFEKQLFIQKTKKICVINIARIRLPDKTPDMMKLVRERKQNLNICRLLRRAVQVSIV